MSDLAAVMLRRNMDIEQLADASGVSRRAIYNYLDGAIISTAYLTRLAQALGVTPEVIQAASGTERRLFNTGEPYAPSRARRSART